MIQLFSPSLLYLQQLVVLYFNIRFYCKCSCQACILGQFKLIMQALEAKVSNSDLIQEIELNLMREDKQSALITQSKSHQKRALQPSTHARCLPTERVSEHTLLPGVPLAIFLNFVIQDLREDRLSIKVFNFLSLLILK